MDEKTIQDKADISYSLIFDKEMVDLIHKATEDTDAEEELAANVLELKLEDTHHSRGTKVWSLLLGTGGPAYRILATADSKGEVIDAVFEYQDWFKPWTAANNQDKELLIDFVSSCKLIYEE